MPKRTFDGFDEYAGNYRQIHSRNIAISGADSLYFAEHKVLQIKSHEIDNGLRMLDVGCGDGATEIFFNKFFPSWIIDGIDISRRSIAEAQNRKIPSVTFQVFNGSLIPFENNSFDIVFIAAVLHHIDFSLHAVLIREIYRVLKPGGRLYLFEHNPLNPFTQYFVKTCEFDKNARLLSYRYSKRLLKTVSFLSIMKKFILFFPRKGILSKMVGLEKYLNWLPLGGQYYYRAIK